MQISNAAVRCLLAVGAFAASTAACAEVSTFVEYSLIRTSRTVVNNPEGWISDEGLSSYRFRQNRVWTEVAGGTISFAGLANIGSAKVLTAGLGVGYQGGGWAGWNDSMTFTGGPAGEKGLVTFNLDYDWRLSQKVNATMDGTSVGLSNAYIDINLIPIVTGGDGFQYASVGQTAQGVCVGNQGQCDIAPGAIETYYQGGTAPNPVAANGHATFSFVVTFGKEYQVTVGINADVGGMQATSMVDATHSLYWGGIASVLDSRGVAVAETVMSASGFDYGTSFANQVPEPQTWVLMVAGLAVVGALGAQRRRRDQGRPSHDPILVPRPVGIAQHALVQLAGGQAR